MDSGSTDRVALMAIQPRYAHAILDGLKQVEFRKRALAPDISTVLIYETAPAQQVVGKFTIARTEQASPSAIWELFGSMGSIRRTDYRAYFADRRNAVGLVIDQVERYRRPVALDELSVRPPVPQSFTYLPSSVLAEIRQLQPREPGQLRALAGWVLSPARTLADARAR